MKRSVVFPVRRREKRELVAFETSDDVPARAGDLERLEFHLVVHHYRYAAVFIGIGALVARQSADCCLRQPEGVGKVGSELVGNSLVWRIVRGTDVACTQGS